MGGSSQIFPPYRFSSPGPDHLLRRAGCSGRIRTGMCFPLSGTGVTFRLSPPACQVRAPCDMAPAEPHPSDQETAVLHDLAAIDPHVGATGQHVDVAGALPISAGLMAVRIAERHVHARELLVLEEVTHDPRQSDVRPDRELAGPVGVGTLGEVRLDLGLDLGMAVHLHGNHAPAPDLKPHRLLQETIPPGEVITQLFPHQQAVDADGCREDLALRKVAPTTLLPVTGVARYPAVAAREGRGQLGAEARRDLDPGRMTHD